MDPAVFGPSFWNLMYDVAYAGERCPRQRQCALSALRALRDLLPCSACRNSYADFWRKTSVHRNLLRRTHSLRECVNDKTHVPEAQRVDYALLRRRMKTWESVCAPNHVWHILCLVAVNRLLRPPETDEAVNPSLYRSFLQDLTCILRCVPGHAITSRTLEKHLRASTEETFRVPRDFCRWIRAAYADYARATQQRDPPPLCRWVERYACAAGKTLRRRINNHGH